MQGDAGDQIEENWAFKDDATAKAFVQLQRKRAAQARRREVREALKVRWPLRCPSMMACACPCVLHVLTCPAAPSLAHFAGPSRPPGAPHEDDQEGRWQSAAR